jgi:hypothetical protein
MTNSPSENLHTHNMSGFKCLCKHVNQNKLKIAVGLILSVFAFVIPMYFIDPMLGRMLIKDYGYWMILAIFSIFSLFLIRLSIQDNLLLKWIEKNKSALLVIAGLTAFLYVNDWHGFKVLYDEYVLSNTAMNMHFHQQATLYQITHVLDNEPLGFVAFVDKRPLFFPFLISLVHRLTGYRPENVVYLNTFLTFVSLSFLFGYVTKLTNRYYGLIAVCLLAGLPLLAENASGGGFDVANLLLINALLLFATLLVEKPDSLRLNLLVFTALIIANTRYESIIYVFIPCIIVLYLWIRNGKHSLTWVAVISPFFLILPLLLAQINFSDEGVLKGSFFGFHNILNNLNHACVYLFSYYVLGTNSLIISVLGMISTVILSVIIISRIRQFSELPPSFIPLIAISIGIIFSVFIALLWGWGEWTDPLASRFSLPLQWLWTVLIPITFYYEFKLKNPPVVFVFATLVFLFFINYPMRGKQIFELKFLIGKENSWAIDYLFKHDLTNGNFFISSSVYGLQLYRLPAMNPDKANKSPSKVFNTTKYGIYKNVYAIQEIQTDYVSGREIDIWADPLSSDFVLETVAEKRFRSNQVVRISRVIGVKGEPTPIESPLEKPYNLGQYKHFLFSLLPMD